MSALPQLLLGVLAVAGVLVAAFVLSFRLRLPVVIDAIRRFNRRVTNPRMLERAGTAGHPYAVVHHVGRRTGTPYRTPIGAVPVDGGFVVTLPYGPDTDWTRNVLAAGGAVLEHDGRRIAVDRPALVPAEQVRPLLSTSDRVVSTLFGIDPFLRLQRADAD